MLAEQARTGSGTGGRRVRAARTRGVSTEKVDAVARSRPGVEGFVGFAIGRSIWWDALESMARRRPGA